MLLLGLQTVGHQKSVLSQLVVEELVFALPPLLLRLTHEVALVLTVSYEQLSLFSSQVVENALIRGDFQFFVFLVFCEFREVVVHDACVHLCTNDSASSLGSF